MSVQEQTSVLEGGYFESIPGSLPDFNRVRPVVLDDVVKSTLAQFDGRDFEALLSESLYRERDRLKGQRKRLFTRARWMRDRDLWDTVQDGLRRPSVESDRSELFEKVLAHYAEEIGGNFSKPVYSLATQMVPWSFNWLLNAASVRRFLPWGMQESLQSRLTVLGEVDHLRALSRRGTILLVPTHQSNIDSVLIGYIIYLLGLPPFSYGAGLNLFSNPALSFFMNHLGAYTVDRLKTNDLYKAILKNYSTRILQERIHSIFFPGGGRSRSGALESKVKLGLLGTALDAQIENIKNGRSNPNVYIVPMVTSYHFVLEASSLIEGYLSQVGRHRFIDQGVWDSGRPIHFFWKLFSSQSGVTVRLGKPLDVFGNDVDLQGESIGPNGTRIDTKAWLTTSGVLDRSPQRDQEYTRQLGDRLVDRYHSENVVLSSHVVAYALFRALRNRYPELDLFRFLRLNEPQRTVPLELFYSEVDELYEQLRRLADRGEIFLSRELYLERSDWIEHGVRNIGVFHDADVVKVRDRTVSSDDLNLLYYYRNRLAGYRLDVDNPSYRRGDCDEQGFLV